MKAPEFDKCLRVYDIRCLNPIHYCKNICNKINELYSLLDQIKECGDNDLKKFYIEVDRGNIEDYGNFKEMLEDGEVDNYEQFKKYWQEDYKEESYFYQLSAVKYEEYRSIIINDRLILSADLKEPDEYGNYYGYEEFLDFLIIKTKETIKMLKENTYNSYINKKLPYDMRGGIIKRKDYWKIYPKSKEILFEGITDDEAFYFIKNAKDKIDSRLEKMNARMYYDFCKFVYKATNYKYQDISSKDLYYKNADGRDEGLGDINEDSFEEFDKWLNDNERFGGHPWEIIPGPSLCRINLFVGNDDKGYYLSVSGDALRGAKDILKLFNVLHQNNIPIKVYYADDLKCKFLGEDYIRIIPKYENTYAHSEKINDNVIFDRDYLSEENFKIKDKVIWDKIEKLCLK